jgi:hypothetical protein
MTTEEQDTNGGEQQVITVEEAHDVYPDQWVLMHVTEHSEAGAPRAGVVLAAGSDEYVLSVMMEDIRTGSLRAPYDRFFANKSRLIDPIEADDLMTEAMLLELRQG